jgi:hypothetical protein
MMREKKDFFSTLSLVFDITIQIMSITNTIHQVITINTYNKINSIKIINKRKSVNSKHIYEP